MSFVSAAQVRLALSPSNGLAVSLSNGYPLAMDQSYAQWMAGAVIVAVVAIGGYYLWRHSAPIASTPATATTTTSQGAAGSVGISGSGSGTVQVIPLGNAPTPPTYSATIVCASDLSSDACSALKARNATLVAQIGKNKTDGNAWLNLGAVRKINEDYKGAEAAWLYVTKLYPSNPVAYSNLADLYLNSLHEYAKAEANYLIAIKLAPNDIPGYQDLFTLYTGTSYHPGSTSSPQASANAAEDILKKGIAANSKAVSLQVLLARYYRSQGRTAEANTEYDAAIANANGQGNTALAAQLTAEKNQ